MDAACDESLQEKREKGVGAYNGDGAQNDPSDEKGAQVFSRRSGP